MPSRKERKKRRRKKQSVNTESDDGDGGDEEPSKDEPSAVVQWYEDWYHVLLAIPLLILAASITVITYQTVTTGTFVQQDVSLKGGLAVTYLSNQTPPASEVESYLDSELPRGDFRARSIEQFGQRRGLTIDATDVERDALITALEDRIPGFTDYNVERIGSALGQSFFQQTMLALLIAFVFMALVVFYYFRTFVPSGAVVLAAFSDIVTTVAMMNVLGIRLSTAGIAALLMLIGYSVDTDILLSTRVLHRHNDTALERLVGAVKTGLTLNLTTLLAVTVALVVSESQTISQIMTILVIGLLTDVVNTWLQNTGILTWYVRNEG